MAPLPEATATCGDVSMYTASVYSCSASQTDVRHARSTFSQSMRCAEKGEKSTVFVHRVEIDDDGAASKNAATRGDASSTSAASIYTTGIFN